MGGASSLTKELPESGDDGGVGSKGGWLLHLGACPEIHPRRLLGVRARPEWGVPVENG